MRHDLKHFSKSKGLPPGSFSLQFSERKTSYTNIIRYNEDNMMVEKNITAENILDIDIHDNYINWIKVEGISDEACLESLAFRFSLNPLFIEDIINPEQRPKIDELSDTIFLVVKFLTMVEKKIKPVHIGLFLQESTLITISETPCFQPIFERLEQDKGRIRRLGADHLLYSLLDFMVDDYFQILEQVGDKLDQLEMKLMPYPTPDLLPKIYEVRRELLYIKKVIWPTRDLINQLKGTHALMSEDLNLYIRDLYDHITQQIESLETMREMITSFIETYLSGISNKMNEIMKVLTIISTIFIPLTFIAGVYGMNFKYMPELELKVSYPIVIIVFVVVAAIMLYFFRKKKWL